MWAYSNCEEVELFLNGKSFGRKKMERNGHLEWKVAYTPGVLEAVGYKKGKKILTDVVKTTGTPAAIGLSAHKTALAADGQDIAVITVDTRDRNKLSVPTAGHEITFRLQGPGKIIGVGNGDPTSLEPEKYIESIQMVAIEDLKEKEVAGMDATGEAAADVADSEWKEAFTTRDYKNLAKAYVHRGSFTLPQDFATAEATFFYKSIGREQSIYINGHEIARNVKEGEIGNGFALDKSILKRGKNMITIVATPIPKKYDWDQVNTDPGVIQLLTPAAAWKRKLFSGLAQVIVQSTKEAGEISLTAESPGLQPATIKLKVDKTNSRLAVE